MIWFLALLAGLVCAAVNAFSVQPLVTLPRFVAVLSPFLLIPLIRNGRLMFQGRRLAGYTALRSLTDATILCATAFAVALLVGSIIFWLWR